jgi:LAO/AO transport system kinase
LTSTDPKAIEALAAGVRAGERRALSRAISWIEDETPEGRDLLDLLYSPSPRAHRIGITGPPGSGKSTLTGELTRLIRSSGGNVGILAVDPTSPFTGGAILGDRIRMQSSSQDPGVFIRSMATRGSLGGLASTTYGASEAMEAAGFDWILIETVGVGQSEMDVVEAVDTTVVVLVPESGDSVQVMKAGLLEAGDLFVINKFDREGGDRIEKEIRLMLELARERRAGKGEGGAWEPQIFRTIATRGEGIGDLITGIEEHRSFQCRDPAAWGARQEKRITQRLRSLVRDRLLHSLRVSGALDEWLEASERLVRDGQASPYALVEDLVSRMIAGKGTE